MKYVVPNEKLYNIIYKMIVDYMNDTEVQWYLGMDPYEGGNTEHEIEFYGTDYTEDIDDTPLFAYVAKEWWTEIEQDKRMITKYLDISPMLEVSTQTQWRYKMDSLFGNLWRPVFEKWFNKTYPQFPVKTFEYYT